MERKETQYTCRHVARITVEAQTPLAVGSGMATIMTDSPVITDINGMPYIPATALAGVVRHAVCLPDDSKDKIFGYQTNNGGRGSQIIFTDAVMIGKDGKALDGICHIDWTDNFYHHYQQLPIRDHVRIDDKGANADTGKFDNEVAYKGTRFVFEIELVSVDDKTDMFDKTIARLYDETFRIGGGTRSGYGKLRVVECKVASLNLCNPVELKQYVAKSSNLSEP